MVNRPLSITRLSDWQEQKLNDSLHIKGFRHKNKMEKIANSSVNLAVVFPISTRHFGGLPCYTLIYS
uniref:Uncharacterized protein n=1 Tax=Triticum urartu TaxID=4572 RepID=A0A8R7P9U1_TRIUA